jgi:hypothetical protein
VFRLERLAHPAPPLNPEAKPEIRGLAFALSNIALTCFGGALPDSNAAKNREFVERAVRQLELFAWISEADGDTETCERILDKLAFDAGIRAIDPPKLSSFPREIAVRAMLAFAARPAVSSADLATFDFPYQETFDAIADAVKATGVGIGISVEKFQASLRRQLLQGQEREG